MHNVLMLINKIILDHFHKDASNSKLSRLTIGLGYTAVELEDGRTGIAFTWLDKKEGCSVIKEADNYEGKNVSKLLEKILSPIPLERTLAVATVNALNHNKAAEFDNDKGTLFEDMNIGQGSKIAMVGYFGPIVKQLNELNAETVIFDTGKATGSPDKFFPFLENDADALILTSTSILNGSMENMLSHINSRRIPAVLLGPTTIMEPILYAHLPVDFLAGTVPVNCQNVVQAIRNGKGTPAIQKFSRKVYTKLKKPSETNSDGLISK